MSLSDFTHLFQVLVVLNFIALSDQFSPITIFFNFVYSNEEVSNRIKIASTKLRHVRLTFESNLLYWDATAKEKQKETERNYSSAHYLSKNSLILELEEKLRSFNEQFAKNNDRVNRLKQSAKALNLYAGLLNLSLLILAGFNQMADVLSHSIQAGLWSVIFGLAFVIVLFLYSNISKRYNFFSFSIKTFIIFTCSVILTIPDYFQDVLIPAKTSFAVLIAVLISTWIVTFILSLTYGVLFRRKLNKDLDVLLKRISKYDEEGWIIDFISTNKSPGGGTTDTGAREVNNDN